MLFRSSREQHRLRITPGVWGQIERFVKASAKRAATVAEFIDLVKPKVGCESLKPRFMRSEDDAGRPNAIAAVGDAFVQAGGTPARSFLTAALANADEKAVLHRLLRETAWVVLLVRDRIERERATEALAQSIDEHKEDHTDAY